MSICRCQPKLMDALLTASVTVIFPSLSCLISCFFVSNCPLPRRSLICLSQPCARQEKARSKL